MYEQLTLPIIDTKDKTTIVYKDYASPCGGCICEQCVNNVDCINVKSGEQKEACFNCDDCYHYNRYGKCNKKYNCDNYCITNYGAIHKRKQLKVI